MAWSRIQTVGLWLSVNDGQFHLSSKAIGLNHHVGTLCALCLGRAEDESNMKKLSEFLSRYLYARAKTKLWSKIERLRGVPSLSVADFGTDAAQLLCRNTRSSMAPISAAAYWNFERFSRP